MKVKSWTGAVVISLHCKHDMFTYINVSHKNTAMHCIISQLQSNIKATAPYKWFFCCTFHIDCPLTLNWSVITLITNTSCQNLCHLCFFMIVHDDVHLIWFLTIVWMNIKWFCGSYLTCHPPKPRIHLRNKSFTIFSQILQK